MALRPLCALLGLITAVSASPLSSSLSSRQLGLQGPSNTTAVLKRNCAYWGWYPDDGIAQYGSQGTLQTLEELNNATGLPAFAVGAYAHIEADDYNPKDPSTFFNGSEILPFIQQAFDTNATFVASISPVHGYGGFQKNDTNQADAIVNVLRDFVDAGVEVWLRWGHEFNWYTRFGSDDEDPAKRRHYYGGNANDFVKAWKVTHDTVRAALPTVKFMWCANVGLMSELRPFWPGPDYVDMVALDFYTIMGVDPGTYQRLDYLIQETHDTFAVPYNKPFWLGETGTRSNSTVDNLNWIDTITSEATCASMPNYQGAFWFNYQKNDLDHRVVTPGGSDVTTAFVDLMSTPSTSLVIPDGTLSRTSSSALYQGFRKVMLAAGAVKS